MPIDWLKLPRQVFSQSRIKAIFRAFAPHAYVWQSAKKSVAGETRWQYFPAVSTGCIRLPFNAIGLFDWLNTLDFD